MCRIVSVTVSIFSAIDVMYRGNLATYVVAASLELLFFVGFVFNFFVMY